MVETLNPLVSVIVPAYNREDFLPQCLNSILAQTYLPIELIVVDDGSTDRTRELLSERFHGKLRYIWHEHTGLPAVARNVGVDAAQGEYIAFCDSDDYWLSEKLDVQLSRLRGNGCNCSCTDAFIDSEQRSYFRTYELRYENPIEELLWRNFIITSSAVFHRSLFRKARFSTRQSLRGYEDYALWLSMARNLRIDFVREPLLCYRRHVGGLSNEVRRRDAKQQIRLLCSRSIYIEHPGIWARKLVREIVHLVEWDFRRK